MATTETGNSSDRVSTVLKVEFIRKKGKPFARVFLVGTEYDIKLRIEAESLVCKHMYKVDDETKVFLGFSMGSLVRLRNVNDPSSFWVEYILQGSLWDNYMVTAVVYQPDWKCFVYALDDGSITVVNDVDKLEVFHQRVKHKVVNLLSVDARIDVIGKKKSWLLGYDPSAGEPIDWWRRTDVMGFIEVRGANRRLF